MTQAKFSNKTESQLKEMARDYSHSLTIRTYLPSSGEDKDIIRPANKIESHILFNILYSALLTYRNNKADLQTILDLAEFTGNMFFKDLGVNVNGYATIYIPLKEMMEE